MTTHSTKILLITPPFTQLNTPYPATAYLKGYFNTVHIDCDQLDLGIEVINKLFSKKGIEDIFEFIEHNKPSLNANCKRIIALKDQYIQTINPVMHFLKDQDPTLAHNICTGNYLPEASKFDQIADLEWAFGAMGIRDKARHLATLYLEDIGDLIIQCIDKHFGFSRYAERLASSAHTFDNLYLSLQKSPTYIDKIAFEILEKQLQNNTYQLVGFSAPFPGNIYSAFSCAQFIKRTDPTIHITLGGGYANTELRSVSDPRVFDFIDSITLDDGEITLLNLVEYLEDKRPQSLLKRTFMRVDGQVTYINNSLNNDIKQAYVGTPDYTGLPLKDYLSVIEIANPMHRLWSDGRWNKLTLAHGCYWGKCTFCDISLDYIKNYEVASANTIVDRMEALIQQTGEQGFHFVDEAAPPAMMQAIALEILRRNLTVTWWANIRFEKNFTGDLCKLLASAGCIAVSGGLEVASDRLLKLIDKGVTVEQVTTVADNFTESGIMVHAYLMYGFPTQTDQETIDSLEVVRQLFENQVLQSGFWHQFAMTAHSPIGLDPKAFKVEKVNHSIGTFANNDIPHKDPTGTDHLQYADGLKKSLFNYMHGMCFEFKLQEWFDFKIPKTSIAPNYILNIIENKVNKDAKPHNKLLWKEALPIYEKEVKKKKGVITTQYTLCVHLKRESIRIPLSETEKIMIDYLLESAHYKNDPLITVHQFKQHLESLGLQDFESFWNGNIITTLRGIGLLIL